MILPARDNRPMASELAVSSGVDFTRPRIITIGDPEKSLPGNVVMVNYYLLDKQPIVAVGYQCPTHADLHIKTKQELAKEIQNSDKFNALVYDLEQNRFDGSLEQSSFILRINDYEGSSRDQLQIITDRYRAALELAKFTAIQAFGEAGRVEVFAPTPIGRQIAKAVGCLHLVTTSGSNARSTDFGRGVTFIKNRIQVTPAGSFYYSKETGTRFKSPKQVLELKSLTSNKRAFIKCLNQMLKMMDPAPTKHSRNRHGNREAMFLVYDSKTGSISTAKDTLLYQALKNIGTSIKENSWLEWDSPAWQKKLQLSIDALWAQHMELTDANFRTDDFSNFVFVRSLEQLLRGGISGLQVMEDFHLPVKAADIGYVTKGEKDNYFNFSQSVLESEQLKQTLTRLIHSIPGAKTADWITLSEPLEPLTYEQRPANFARNIFEPRDFSVIIEVGRFNEKANRWVIRTQPFPENSWRDPVTGKGKTPRIEEMLALNTESQLSGLVRHYMRSQVALMNRILEPVGLKPVPAFETLKILYEGTSERYLIRPLVGAKGLDQEDRLTMSHKRMQDLACELGKLMYVNFVAARPVFPLHEIFLEDTAAPHTELRTIGTAESFCNSLNCRNTADYLNKAARLYGAHVFSWIASYAHGSDYAEQRDSNATSRLAQASRITKIEQAFEQGFEQAAIIMQQPENKAGFIKELKNIANSYDHLRTCGFSLPREFDIRQHIEQNIELLNLDSNKIQTFFRAVKKSVDEISGFYEKMLVGVERDVFSAHDHAELIAAIHSLISNHTSDRSASKRLTESSYGISGKVYNEIMQLLEDNKGVLRAFTPSQRIWLITVADISAWLKEVGKVSLSELENLALAPEQVNAESFMASLPEKIPQAYLSNNTARRFYEAINGLRKLVNSIPKDKPTKLAKVLKGIEAWSLGEINWQSLGSRT